MNQPPRLLDHLRIDFILGQSGGEIRRVGVGLFCYLPSYRVYRLGERTMVNIEQCAVIVECLYSG